MVEVYKTLCCVQSLLGPGSEVKTLAELPLTYQLQPRILVGLGSR